MILLCSYNSFGFPQKHIILKLLCIRTLRIIILGANGFIICDFGGCWSDIALISLNLLNIALTNAHLMPVSTRFAYLIPKKEKRPCWFIQQGRLIFSFAFLVIIGFAPNHSTTLFIGIILFLWAEVNIKWIIRMIYTGITIWFCNAFSTVLLSTDRYLVVE